MEQKEINIPGLQEAAIEYGMESEKQDNDYLGRCSIEDFIAGAKWMAQQGVTINFLSQWYQKSVDATPPVWTDKHLEELTKDFILIKKNNNETN